MDYVEKMKKDLEEVDRIMNEQKAKKYNLEDLKGHKIKADNGNIGYYARWQSTASGIRVWLEDKEGHVVGSIKLKDITKFED